MSIIHDALKKVQEKNAKQAPSLSAKDPAIHDHQATPTQEQAVVPAENHKPLTILLLGTLSVVVVLVFAILWNLAKGTTEHALPPAPPAPQAEAVPEPQTPAANEAVPQAPAPAPTSESLAAGVIAPAPAAPQIDPNDPLSALRIEGIMDMGDKKVALISGNIYEEGQTIYGKIIAEIALDSVTIVDNGSRRTFPVNPPKP